MKYTLSEIVGTQGGALLPERAPGACSGSTIPRVYQPLSSGLSFVSVVQPRAVMDQVMLMVGLPVIAASPVVQEF